MNRWEATLQRSWRDLTRTSQVTHVRRVSPRAGTTENWPVWTAASLVERLERDGIAAPWEHQVTTANIARGGTSVILATGTASGKSLAFLLPCLTAVAEGRNVLYLSPTKALAADQLQQLRRLCPPALRAATYDGDTAREERAWIRSHANYVLTNPDTLHHSILPRHASWAGFLRRLRYVVIDETHRYRGVFGSHVAQILRRLRRVCAHYGSDPVFILTSATVATPEESARRLTGLPVRAVVEDASPSGARHIALLEPELTDRTGENGAPVRRAATAVAAETLADLVAAGARTLAFVRSRQAAELLALSAQRALGERRDYEAARRVAAYRAGYLADDRRELEAALRDGELLGVASTNALELGVNITGLDAVIVTGWPGTLASLWQQVGRAGRTGHDALAVFIARDDPLDTYLVHHPEAVFDRPVESTVLDPDNPYVMEPHLCAAAAELPLTEADMELFGPAAPEVLAEATERKLLRRRPRGWFWTSRDSAAARADLRGAGGTPIQIVDAESGQLLGSVDEAAAHGTVHDGAVYLHQGQSYLVDRLDLDAGVALVRAADPEYRTWARETTEIEILGLTYEESWGGNARVCFGDVRVRRNVVGYLRRDVRTGAVLGEHPLDLPERALRSRAMWWTLSPEAVERLRAADVEQRGAAHAAEHAAIGLLPLFATCDRWDIGGVSTVAHPDTGSLTVFVYDGHEGGAGFAERGYAAARSWLAATREAVAACECRDGCPSCVQSPKCGNGNEPLSKSGAVRLLDMVLEES